MATNVVAEPERPPDGLLQDHEVTTSFRETVSPRLVNSLSYLGWTFPTYPLPVLASNLTLNNLRFIQNTMREQKPVRTLEISCLWCLNACVLLGTPKSRSAGAAQHTAIDPFQARVILYTAEVGDVDHLNVFASEGSGRSLRSKPSEGAAFE